MARGGAAAWVRVGMVWVALATRAFGSRCLLLLLLLHTEVACFWFIMKIAAATTVEAATAAATTQASCRYRCCYLCRCC